MSLCWSVGLAGSDCFFHMQAHEGKSAGADLKKRHIRALTEDEAAAAARFVPRVPCGARPLIYEYDGDQNGVIHHFGTNFGTQQWVNPVLAGRVEVRLPPGILVCWMEALYR